jgi:hypothetical protein
MTLSIKNIVIGLLTLVLGSYALYAITTKTYAAVTYDNPSTVNQFRTYEFFASTTAATGSVSSTVIATTTTATSTNITAFMDNTYGRYVDGSFNTTGAKKVTMYFSRGGATHANTGSTVYTVQGTKDGSTWTNIDQLVSATSTSVSNALVQSSASITAATSTLVFGLDLDYVSYKSIRCIVYDTTD